jgi:hypothetical protein
MHEPTKLLLNQAVNLNNPELSSHAWKIPVADIIATSWFHNKPPGP